MAETPQKEVVSPMTTTKVLDQLQQVHELNRAFLGWLQSAARDGRTGIGLPVSVWPVIAAASGPLLDGVARFPRALFHLDLRFAAQARAERDAGPDEAEHDLCLLIVLAVRNTTRQSAYQARLLFGLTAVEVERLCSSPLAGLQRLAGTPGVLGCVFREQRWFWHGLFEATRPELRRQLTLMALQPGVALGWPRRRPPQASV
jgi:hypothetical protein